MYKTQTNKYILDKQEIYSTIASTDTDQTQERSFHIKPPRISEVPMGDTSDFIET